MVDVNNEIEMTEVSERDNLCVVHRIERLESIPGKDRVELCVLVDCGFSTVVEKGLHKKNDLVVFVKYDSIVPDNELFAFMLDTKGRVKQKSFTHKDEEGNVFAKTYSQGIVLPINLVSNFLYGDGSIFDEGEDLTSALKIVKYIPPANNGGGGLGNMQKKGDFPSELFSKTDEDNLSSRTSALFELQGLDVYFTLKSEGSSLSCYVDPETKEFNVCTRNNILKECEGSKFWDAVNKYNLKETHPESYPNIAISGELVGPGVQKNHHGLSGSDLHVFSMTDISDEKRRLSLTEMYDVVEDLGLTMVKVVYGSENFQIVPNIENDTWNPKVDPIDSNTVWTFDRLQKFADAQVYDNGSLAEGIVIRPVVPFKSRALKTWFSGKIINRDYRL